MDITPFLPLITGALGGATTAGVFKGPIQTLEDWWYINFGYNKSSQAEMLRAQQEANVEALKEQLLSDVSKIEPKNVKDPKLNILGPALEASRYYIEDENLRKMFSKLIASSMDASKEKITRTSFVEIVKQLEPIDAQNLKWIFDKKDDVTQLVCNIEINYSTGGATTVYSNVFLGNPNIHNQEILGPSLENLARLGLIEITYQQHRTNIEHYKVFEETIEFKKTLDYISSTNRDLQMGREVYPSVDKYQLELSGPSLQKGVIIITNLGKSFCSICL